MSDEVAARALAPMPRNTFAEALAPSSFAEVMAFCEIIAKSDLASRDYRGKPGNVLVAVQMGSELGLRPLQALQNIAVINGKPSVYGDAALALIKQHPRFVSCEETMTGENESRVATCSMVRDGEPKPITRSFSVADARRAKLWGKQGPWTEYPDRMLQMRARGFAGRDAFPDALKGLSFAEEAQDMTPPAHVVSPATIDQDALPSHPPANPVQAVLAARAAEKAGKLDDSPEGRVTAVAMIRTFCEKQGLEMPDLLGNESIEGLRSVMESLREEAIAKRDAAAPAEEAPVDAVSRLLPPDSDGVKASDPSLRKLFAELKDVLGITQKNERLSWAHKFGGQLGDLQSFAELSQGQVSYLLDRLKETPSPTSAATCPSCGSFAGAGHAPDCELSL